MRKYAVYSVRQNETFPKVKCYFSQQPLGILTRNFTRLLAVYACINKPSGIWYSFTAAELQNLVQDDITILHIQKLSAVMSCMYWKQLGPSCCLWWQSKVSFITDVNFGEFYSSIQEFQFPRLVEYWNFTNVNTCCRDDVHRRCCYTIMPQAQHCGCLPGCMHFSLQASGSVGKSTLDSQMCGGGLLAAGMEGQVQPVSRHAGMIKCQLLNSIALFSTVDIVYCKASSLLSCCLLHS